MPAILDVAIGTFFVFLLFSIVVTALNEVVLTFFDKRADFLRLGLGELLGDSQQDKVRGYFAKVIKYGSSELWWAASWLAAIPAALVCFVGWWTGGIVAALAVFYLIGHVQSVNQSSQVQSMKGMLRQILEYLKLWQKTPEEKTLPADKIRIGVEEIFKHPLVFSLSKGESDPSYIRASAFSKAVLDLLVPASETDISSTKPPLKDIQAAILKLENAALRKSLAALLRSVEGDIGKFQTALEDWFNHSMERVTGWYKRHAQTWLLILGFGLAVACNVDALRIIRTLSQSPNLAKAVSAQAGDYLKKNDPPHSEEVMKAARALKDEKIQAARTKLSEALAAQEKVKLQLEEAKEKQTQATTEEARKAASAEMDTLNASLNNHAVEAAQKELEQAVNWDGVLADFKSDLQELSKTGIPMGWDKKMCDEFGLLVPEAKRSDANPWHNVQVPWHWHKGVCFTALCGWVLTALAGSLGAPFWFDLLQRVMNLRANGRAPEENTLNTKEPARKTEPAAEMIGAAAGAAAGAVARTVAQPAPAPVADPPPTVPTPPPTAADTTALRVADAEGSAKEDEAS